MVKVIFRDETEKVMNKKQFAFVMGIKNIKTQVKTYKYL